ncbi:putative uncharacterized protein FLJ45840 [Prinia subflava]|uniref:putative uncharacterized protein FLJ45840 n=1 Tax=Prinia subflava TaxID=208062 RepID=UPI002FE1E3DB
MGRRGGAGARRGERAREGAANLFRKKESKWRFCGCAKFINSALTSPPPRLPGGERWARLGTPPRRAPRAPPPPARPRAPPRTLIRRHITCRSGSSPGDALPRRQQPVANSISNSPSSRGGRGASKERSEHNFPPHPSSVPPFSARQRSSGMPGAGAGGARGGGQVPRGAPRLPLLRRPRPRGSPGPAWPAALPARRACPPAAGRSPGSGLERIRSRRWRCRAAGFKEFAGALRCRGNVCASSSACRPGASPGVSHPSRPKGRVKFSRTVNVRTGAGGANAVSNQRRDAAACTYRILGHEYPQ